MTIKDQRRLKRQSQIREALYAPQAQINDIVVVGLNSQEDYFSLAWIAAWLAENRPEMKLTRRILARDYDVYDMTTKPEKGDALDAIGSNTRLVIAMHLFGIDKAPGGNTALATQLAPDRCYNRCNIMMLPLCMRHGAALVAIGDQPWMNVQKETTMHEREPLIRIYEPAK